PVILIRDEHFTVSKNIPIKVGSPLSFLAKAREVSDRQSKKRRWLSYKSSCAVQVQAQNEHTPTNREQRLRRFLSALSCFGPSALRVSCGYIGKYLASISG